MSQVLAKKSKKPSPPQIDQTPRRRRSSLVEQDDSPAVGQAPRLSLPLRDLDDESFHEQPPRLSYPLNSDEDEDEIETRRRAALGRDRQSLPSYLDPSLMDLNELGPGDYEDVAEARQRLLEQDMSIHVDDVDDDGETAELRALLEARRQSGQMGEETEITDGEPTFLFRIPERSRLSLAPTVPRTPDGRVAGNEVEVEEEYEDVEEEDAVAGAYEDDDEDNLRAIDDDDEMHDPTLREASIPLADDEAHADAGTAPKAKTAHKRLPKEVKVSRFGIEYPSFPPTVVKRLANTFSRQYGGSGKLSKDTLAAIGQASDWFFEQISEDLADYATHAGRKTIEEADVVTLMKRYVVPFLSGVHMSPFLCGDLRCLYIC